MNHCRECFCPRITFIQMKTLEIYTNFEGSRKTWNTKRLLFILNHLIQTKGPAVEHVHHQMLIDEFPEQFKKMKSMLPLVYPVPPCCVCMFIHKRDRTSGVFIQNQKSAAEHRRLNYQTRKILAAAARRADAVRRYQHHKHQEGPSICGPHPWKHPKEFVIKATTWHHKPGHNIFTGKQYNQGIRRSRP